MASLVQLGMVVVFLGIILIMIGSLTTIGKQEKINVRAAGGIFIGPFPLFGFASDRQMMYVLLGITVLLIILFLIFGKVR